MTTSGRSGPRGGAWTPGGRCQGPWRCTIEVLRVSAHSIPNKVAGAIAGVLRDVGTVEVQAIGAEAVNQAVKAIAITRSYLEGDRYDLTAVPEFVKLRLHDQERTAIKFAVVRHPYDEGEAGSDARPDAEGESDAEAEVDADAEGEADGHTDPDARKAAASEDPLEE